MRAGDRPEYLPVLYVKPYAGNEAALGFDLLSTPSRSAAIKDAISTGELPATQRITLVQETSNQYGILIFRPVYEQGRPFFGKRRLLGFALGVLRLGDVVQKHGGKSGVDFLLTDLSAGTPGEQLYPSASRQPQTDLSIRPVPHDYSWRTQLADGRVADARRIPGKEDV